jgi:hypothetical protein
VVCTSTVRVQNVVVDDVKLYYLQAYINEKAHSFYNYLRILNDEVCAFTVSVFRLHKFYFYWARQLTQRQLPTVDFLDVGRPHSQSLE